VQSHKMSASTIVVLGIHVLVSGVEGRPLINEYHVTWPDIEAEAELVGQLGNKSESAILLCTQGRDPRIWARKKSSWIKAEEDSILGHMKNGRKHTFDRAVRTGRALVMFRVS